MRRTFTTMTDLRDYLADTMQLEPEAVRVALSHWRRLWGRFEEITTAQLAAISRAVYGEVTGQRYPADWARRDDEAIERGEAEADG